MARALKVYRTAIGFHDAYVAVPSKKAALAAWGANSDLFAIGSAELVADPKLAAEALASPGKVIKRARGSLDDHLRVARADDISAKSASRPSRQTSPRPKPRPDRKKLSHTEAALDAARAEADAAMAEFDRREAELRQERQALEDRLAGTVAKLEQATERARVQYEREMARWRAD